MIHTSSIEFLNAKEPIIQRTNIIGIKYFVLTLIAFKKKGIPIKVRIIKNNTETAKDSFAMIEGQNSILSKY